MTFKVSGVFAAATIVALTGAASAQSTTNYYQQIQGGYQTGTIAPAATSTYQTPTIVQPTTSYAPPPATTYAPQASSVYAAPAASTYTPQQAGSVYATAPATSQATTASPTQSYGSPYTPTPANTYAAPAPTYVAPSYGSASTTYQSLPSTSYGGTITSQPLAAPIPATAYTPSVPASTQPSDDAAVQDTDAWAYNFARFYPAVQACLRRSTAKNPVIANIQEQGNQTMMLVGEGGSSSYSTCSTGLTGTVVKANSDIRTLPPAFYAPLGSTFTVSPERPFQPIVDTDQKVIGWLVRTQPAQGVNQYGQSVGFDGQFIPPMMVNTSVGKS